MTYVDVWRPQGGARAEAMREVFGAIYRRLKAAAGTAAGLARHAGAGAALRPPHGHFRHGRPARLTGCCN